MLHVHVQVSRVLDGNLAVYNHVHNYTVYNHAVSNFV